jgi:predicted porin
MQKIALAIASLVCAAGASAQSSVTRLSSSTAHTSGVSSGELSSSRFGLRGVEDLGGGLKAGFWLEAGVSMDTGGSSLRFDRRSTISLSNDLGELRLGRDKIASYVNIEAFDPFGDTGVGGNGASNLLGSSAEGTAAGSHPKRLSNMLGYTSPKFGGVQAQLQYSFAERANNQPNKDRGKGLSARLSYASGPLSTAIGYAEMSGGTDTQQQTYKALNLGASWDFGVVKPMLMWARENGANRSMHAVTLGASAPIGKAGELRVAFTQFDNKSRADADSRKFALGYVHKLSKRTALYGTVARVSNDDNATRGLATSSSALASPSISGGDNVTGYSVGIRHSF